jgi:metallo-beta-lactamase class B
VLRSVEELGFDPAKIRILLNSHAHFDHAGGFAAVRKKTGAKLYLSARDAELAARGGKNDFAFGDRFSYTPVVADQIVEDGETVRLGEIAMTAVLTPGHTQGCTTWRSTVVHEGKPLEVLFLCSLTAPGYKLVGNAKYPHIVDDFRRSFDRLRQLRPDVFLANHESFFDLTRKLEELREGKANPFIDSAEFPRFLDSAWKTLEAEIAKQPLKLPGLGTTEPVADTAHSGAKRQRRREIRHFHVDQSQLRSEQVLDFPRRPASGANGPPVERMSLAPMAKNIVRAGFEPAE